ncbi:MAG: hypothetical protein HS115_12680 [Spirochaetales bacterium]|nr:hypothetical protein [Spirochaetales bacterium]
MRLAALFLVWLVLGRLSAEPAPFAFYRLPVDGCDFLFSSAYEPAVGKDRASFLSAMRRLNTILEDRALDRRCRIIFTVNRLEMQTYLEEVLRLSAADADRAVRLGSYRRDTTYIALVGQADLPWSSAFFLTEYARQAILSRPGTDPGAAYFVEGLAVVLAWTALYPEKPQTLESYYGPLFDARRPRSLGSLFHRADFDRQVADHGIHVLAQSALSVYYLGRRSGDFSKLIHVLKSFEKEKNFSGALKRATGLTLEQYEEELYHRYYPLFHRS